MKKIDHGILKKNKSTVMIREGINELNTYTNAISPTQWKQCLNYRYLHCNHFTATFQSPTPYSLRFNNLNKKFLCLSHKRWSNTIYILSSAMQKTNLLHGTLVKGGGI